MIRLSKGQLEKSELDGIVRLSNFLELNISRKEGESEGSFKHRLIQGIMYWEKINSLMKR